MNFKQAASKIKSYLGRSGFVSVGGGWNYPGSWNKTAILQQYVRYVYPIVSSIAEEAAKIEFEVVKVSENGKVTVLKKHPFLDFIKKPNEDQSQFQFLELHFSYMKVSGQSFWYMPKSKKQKKPVATKLFMLRPDLVEVVVATENNPEGLITSYKMIRPDGNSTEFTKDEIVYFKMPNLLNPKEGMGPVEAGKTYIETEEYSSNWTKNAVYNSGRPSGVLGIKGKIGKDAFDAVKKEYKEKYSGAQNAGKTMLLNGMEDLIYQKLGMELGDVSLKDLKNLSRDDIMIMFRVSKTMLGITDDVNRANAREAKLVFIENVIRPELDRFCDHLNAFVMPLWGDGAMVRYKNPAPTSDAEKLTEDKEGVNKWKTINEVRSERGLKKIAGGDEIYQPINLVPIGREITGPEEKSIKPHTHEVKKKLSDKQSRFVSSFYALQERYIPLYERAVNKELDRQKKQILSRPQNKAHKKDLGNWLFDADEVSSELLSSLFPIGYALTEDEIRLALESLGEDPNIAEVTSAIQELLKTRIQMLGKNLSDEITAKLTQSITEGVSAGESVAKLRARVEEVYEGISRIHANLIARTESIAASNEGTLQAYRQSPMVSAKEWTAEAYDSCELCMSLNGKIMQIEGDFVPVGSQVTGSNGQVYVNNYLPIKAPPLHPNCRCALLPVGDGLSL